MAVTPPIPLYSGPINLGIVNQLVNAVNVLGAAGDNGGVVIAGASTPTLAVTGTTTISGANTGDDPLSGHDTGDLADSTDARYVTDAHLVILGNTSNTNTGDQTDISGNAATVTNATLTTALTVNTGTVTLTGNVANSSVLTLGAGAISISGTNTGDQTISDATVTFTDITTNDVSTTKHGFAPKAPDDAAQYLDGTGSYSVPAGGASDINGLSDAVADNSVLYNLFMGTDSGGTTPLGSNNVAIGQNTMKGTSTSATDHNTAIGYNALAALTSGPNNVAVGYNALTANTTGANQVAIGANALTANTANWHGSVAIGYNALVLATTSAYNTGVGYSALEHVTTGQYNTAVGINAGVNTSTGDNNVSIGRNAAPNLGAGSDRISIGYSASCAADNTWVVGTIGKKQAIVEGSNAAMGLATLSGGAITVANTLVTANSRIFITAQADGGTPGSLRVSGRSAGTNFVITSSSGADTSTVAWEIKEPNA
ncbi:hypothetical protein KAR91_18195 [Candidatus Pacearchaeota archaeon]|nr:hypothetical protein [Candidatus Pacearchaeota archaeon]